MACTGLALARLVSSRRLVEDAAQVGLAHLLAGVATFDADGVPRPAGRRTG